MKTKYRDLDEFFEKTDHTQQWLADQLGIERSYVSLIAGGKRQPALDLAIRIEEITGVPLKSLIREEASA